jgi:MFS family permease
LLIFTNTVSIGAFPALLPEIGRAGALPDWQLGAVAAAFGFARTIADIPVGVFITRHLRRALVLSPLLLAGGVLLLGSGGPLPVLVAARAVMGVAHALGLVAGLTAILRFQATGRLSSALSAFELSAMLGILGATLMIGLLPASLPWNLAFLITCAPQLLGIALIPVVLAALPGDAAGTGGWFRRRAADAGPAAPITRGVVLAFAAGGVIAVAYATLEQFAIPLRGDREFGLSRSGIAGLLLILQLCDIVCLLPVGMLADRHGASRVLGLMLLLFGVGVALVAFGDFTGLLAGCALVGIAMAAWTLPLSLLRGETPPERIAWRTAVYRVGVDGGIFLGPFLSGLLTERAPWLLPGALVALLLAIGAVLVHRSLPVASRPGVAGGRR